MGMSKKQLHLIEEYRRRVGLCRQFMNDWLVFNQIINAYNSPDADKSQLENQFLQTKSKLAREHKVLKETLQEDYGLDNNTMNIISGATSLEAIHGQSEVAVKKLHGEWHRAFISINETLGTLEDKLARAEAGEKLMMAPGMGGGGGGGGFALGKNATVVLVLFGILALIVLFILINPGGMADMWREPLGLD